MSSSPQRNPRCEGVEPIGTLMKLTLFACGLVIVLLSKGALAQPVFETTALGTRSPVAVTPTLEPASSRNPCVVDLSGNPAPFRAMQNRVVMVNPQALDAAAAVPAGNAATSRDRAT